jgi:cellulose synthase/poly-beta-1,6-N-acetylglucosamine synthase-like glycosyltransferase
MILSILIPTLTKRRDQLNQLIVNLQNQISGTNSQGLVEILINEDQGQKNTGLKRNELKKIAKGDYIIYLDDDDEPAQIYISELLKAAEHKKDCIVFNGYVTTNGKDRVNFKLRLGEKYEARDGLYYRYPNHITAMKRELVKDVDFPLKTVGEDYEYATKIRDLGLLKSQYVIEKDLYHYKFLTKK